MKNVYNAGFQAGYWEGRKAAIEEIVALEGALDRDTINKSIVSELAKEAYQKYENPKKADFANCLENGDARFNAWAHENLGWDLEGEKIPNGVQMSISAMRAFFENQAFYIDKDGRQKKIDRTAVNALLDDIRTLKEAGLSPVLQDFVTKNVKIKDKEGHIFVWWQKSGSLCLVQGIYKPTGQFMFFKGNALLPEAERTEGAKCYVKAGDVATYIRKMHVAICKLWQHVRIDDE